MSRKNTELDFWAKVDKSGNCWLWLASTRGHMKYGGFKYQGKTWAAHRFSYKITYGDIPAEMQVLHTCDNPQCVNPKHLVLGTNEDNVRDKMTKGRHRTNSPFGEKQAHSKLTDSIIIQIRHENKVFNQRELAEKYGVNQSTISRALNNSTWRHVK